MEQTSSRETLNERPPKAGKGKKMEELKNEMVELNLDEMEEAAGGARHFTKQKDRAGWIQHKVGISDTLIKIAKRYGIANWRKIREWNPHIDKSTNMIRTGEYLWIKK